jgi:hypothetical protein
MRTAAIFVLLLTGCLLAAGSRAAVLEDDRADLMYHLYDGGGVRIDGPALLVRKKFEEKYAVSASYYVDMVSSASIDVVTTASPYTEERTQYGLGAEYLRGKSTYRLGFSNSTENDYEADTASIAISQDMFGDLTSLQLSFARGWDKVFRRGDSAFSDRLDRRVYGVDLTQVATKSLLLGLSWETITEEGFLNNPYRSVRYLDADAAAGFAFEPERYPRTRTGNALAARGRQFLPWRAAVQLDYRWYTDSWGIRAHTAQLGYTHPVGPRLVLDAHYRWYTQDAADFYADLFPRSNFQNFLARDKELSTMASQTIGVAASYEFSLPGADVFKKTTLNLKYDYILFDYDDFRDLRVTGVPPGSEPLYKFNASVVQLFLSGWF